MLVFVVAIVIVAGFEKNMQVHLMTSPVPLARGVSDDIIHAIKTKIVLDHKFLNIHISLITNDLYTLSSDAIK